MNRRDMFRLFGCGILSSVFPTRSSAQGKRKPNVVVIISDDAGYADFGCRVCIAACPYTRKPNWIHRAALQVTANDPTGVSDRLLAGMQKRFYTGPEPSDYYAETLGGKNASYRRPPWWLRTEDFIEL